MAWTVDSTVDNSNKNSSGEHARIDHSSTDQSNYLASSFLSINQSASFCFVREVAAVAPPGEEDVQARLNPCESLRLAAEA